MHAVTALAAGVAGAGNGTANLYARGTTQRATYYLDFEATIPDDAELQLDTNGRVVVYVNQLVDLVVADADGVEVLRCVAGAAAPAVEVRSQSFTGTDYVTAQQAAGKPTTLQAVLDAWKASSGAVDWKVLVAGAATTLETAIAGVVGMVFNVKAPAYGARGDGSNDDTSAIQAALTAAVAGGGVVYFPPGNYRITSTLNLGIGVAMVGSGPSATFISFDAPNGAAVTITSTATTSDQTIARMCFKTNQASSVDLVASALAGIHLNLIDVWFCPGASHTGTCVDLVGAASGTLDMTRCFFRLREASSALDAAGVVVRASQCRIESVTDTLNPTNGFIWRNLGDGLLIGCTWDLANVTTGAGGLIRWDATTLGTMSGCRFSVGVWAATLRLQDVVETGTAWPTSGTVAYTLVGASSTTFAQSRYESVQETYRAATNAGVSTTITDETGTMVVTNTAAGNFTVVLPSTWTGRKLRVIVHNNDGTNRNVSWFSPAAIRPTGAVTVNANCFSIFEFQLIFFNAAYTWVYSTLLANSPE